MRNNRFEFLYNDNNRIKKYKIKKVDRMKKKKESKKKIGSVDYKQDEKIKRLSVSILFGDW